MAQVLSFPDADDRQQVREIVVRLTKKQIKHNDMMIMVADILNWYHITKLDLGDFMVRLIDYYKDLPIVIVECRNMVDSEYCPVCGSSVKRARYLHTNREGTKTDLVSWSCLDCGTFYETESPNGEGMKC